MESGLLKNKNLLGLRKNTSANSVLAKCGVKCKVENAEIFIRRCFSIHIFFCNLVHGKSIGSAWSELEHLFKLSPHFANTFSVSCNSIQTLLTMEFEYNKNKIFANLIFGFTFLFFVIFISTMILRKMILEWNEFNIGKVILALISILLFSILTYLFLGTAIIRNKYFKYNLQKEIKLNAEERKVIVFNKLNQTQNEIEYSDIKSVELFYSWNTNPFSSDLGYSKLNLKNDKKSLIITQNNINQYHIYIAFKNKIVTNKSNFMNNLDV